MWQTLFWGGSGRSSRPVQWPGNLAPRTEGPSVYQWSVAEKKIEQGG